VWTCAPYSSDRPPRTEAAAAAAPPPSDWDRVRALKKHAHALGRTGFLMKVVRGDRAPSPLEQVEIAT
jgi:hypothetical protein